MRRPEQPRPNMDPRAKEFADSLYSDLQSLLFTIPVVIVCIVIAVVIDARPMTIIWIAMGASLALAALRAFVIWLRTALRTDPATIDEPGAAATSRSDGSLDQPTA